MKLTCNATGDGYPPDVMDWFKDGIKLTSDVRRHISIDVSLAERTITSQLSVERASMVDAGTYVCRTSNKQITSSKVNVLNSKCVGLFVCFLLVINMCVCVCVCV